MNEWISTINKVCLAKKNKGILVRAEQALQNLSLFTLPNSTTLGQPTFLWNCTLPTFLKRKVKRGETKIISSTCDIESWAKSQSLASAQWHENQLPFQKRGKLSFSVQQKDILKSWKSLFHNRAPFKPELICHVIILCHSNSQGDTGSSDSP